MNKERKASGGGIRGERVLEGGEKGLLRGNKGRKGSVGGGEYEEKGIRRG